MIIRRGIILLALAACTASALAQKKPLDSTVYDTWNTIRFPTLSRNGQWIAYGIGSASSDATLTVKSLTGANNYTYVQGGGARFTKDGKFVVFIVQPTKAETDAAKKEKKEPKDMPKSKLMIVSLADGSATTIEAVRSFAMPNDDAGWLTYDVDTGPPPTAGATPGAGGAGRGPGAGAGRPPGAGRGAGAAGGQGGAQTGATPPAGAQEQQPATGKRKDHAPGTTRTFVEIATGRKVEVADLADYRFMNDGKSILAAVSTKAGEGDGLFVIDLSTGAKTTVMAGMAQYRGLFVHDKTGKVAFFSNLDDYKATTPAFDIYAWSPGGKAMKVAKAGDKGLPKDYQIVSTGSPTFSDSGKRLMFRIQPKPAPDPKPAAAGEAEAEKAEFDLWSWTDPELQPMQLLRVAQERNKSYEAMVDLGSGSIVQLSNPDLPSVSTGVSGDGEYFIGSSNLPYRQLVSWDTSYSDYFLVRAKDGQPTRFLDKQDGFTSMSRTGKYVTWYDNDKREWMVMDVPSRSKRSLSGGIPYPVWDETHDSPSNPGPYGMFSQVENDDFFIVYDRYDLWACDPKGKTPPVCLTQGYGRLFDLQLRPVILDREDRTVKMGDKLLLAATDLETKSEGFYRITVGAKAGPDRLIWAAKNFGAPTKAEDADVIYFTRQTIEEYPDLWVSNSSFESPRKITDANPQQKNWNWATSEMVQWYSNDGVKLKGILMKPENFDPTKKYPMIVYFYEELSNTIHNYRSPNAGTSINPIMYASRGYLVFMPDIPYKIGYPGESALKAITSGVSSIAERGFLDVSRVGMQGHSWGGYQVAYLVTATSMFRCGVSGAPVSNMTSAYGGIRWGSGMVREFQYEKTQSRIGGTLWEKPMQYYENSPIFHLEKVTTPLLIIHNDKDGAVPWYQGIELFTGLRRLSKPAWLLVYNGEDHGLAKKPNIRDWTQRMEQFFDYYLKDGPMPRWMVEGIPAVNKGKDFGFDPYKPGKGG